MRVIVAGGRDYGDKLTLERILDQHYYHECCDCDIRITAEDGIVSGGAPGADRLGEAWARERKVKVTVFPATNYGSWPSCGPKRNSAMVQYAHALIAFPTGGPGTADVTRKAKKAWGERRVTEIT